MNITGKFMIVATLAVAPAPAMAQAYPIKPVRVVVAFAPGGGADIVGRTLSQHLTERLGHDAHSRGGVQ